MSTATLTPPAAEPAAPPAFDAAAFVRGLSEDDKEAVLVELFRELHALHGESAPVPVYDADRTFLGCYQSPATTRALLDEIGVPAEESLPHSAAGDGIPIEEFIAKLRAGVDSPPSPAPPG